MIEFIDNAEDRIVVEVDAHWYEYLEMDLLNHMGLPPNWSTTKREYTGDTYIITMERLWV
jgi:hypothetical protein